jgi:S1-C subfamily serine protease
MEDYERLVRPVPVVLDTQGLSSGYVVGKSGETALIITNNHAVARPFTTSGARTALVVFYDAELVRSAFTRERLGECKSAKSTWCEAADRAIRRADVVVTDETRDLALLRVTGVPDNVEPLANGSVRDVTPLMSVMIVGHPRNLLWTVTEGKLTRPVSRVQWSQGRPEIEMVQTAAPIHHGNSGGPFLTVDQRVVAVVAGGPLETLNFGVAISEIDRFLRENERKVKSLAPCSGKKC